jgi:hypothetical protein
MLGQSEATPRRWTSLLVGLPKLLKPKEEKLLQQSNKKGKKKK